MKYEAYRQNIKSGDLLAWSTKSMHSINDFALHMVRIFTESEYEHVGIAWVIGGRVFVVEAVVPAVRIYPLSRLVPFYSVQMHIEWQAEYEEWLLSNIGDKYSILKAIKSYWGPIKEDDCWQCAELTIKFYKTLGIDLGVNYTPSAVVSEILKLDDKELILITG